MISFCADDIGFSSQQFETILECYNNGVLNCVSVIPNGKYTRDVLIELKKYPQIAISMHLNILEGKCCSNPQRIPLLVDKDGFFKLSFIKLLFLSALPNRRIIKEQIVEEIASQLNVFSSLTPQISEIHIDGHQHVQIIPIVLSSIISLKVEERFNIVYIRIPNEPLAPFLLHPSLFYRINIRNLLKTIVLHILWQCSKKKVRKHMISTSVFFGVLSSGHMSINVLKKLLPHFIKIANKKNVDLEILFHPCRIDFDKESLVSENIRFSKFYNSAKRSLEKNTLIELTNIYKNIL